MGGGYPGGPPPPYGGGGFANQPLPAAPQQGRSTGATIAMFGCGGCGCLIALGGIGAIVLAVAGVVNRSEVGTTMAVGVGNLVFGSIGILIAVIVFFVAKK